MLSSLISMGKDVEPDVEYTTVGISVPARDALAAFCRRQLGMNVREVASALALWFVRQEPVAQTAILGKPDKGMEVHYAAALRRLADELEGKSSAEKYPITEEGDPTHRTGARRRSPTPEPESTSGRPAR